MRDIRAYKSCAEIPCMVIIPGVTNVPPIHGPLKEQAIDYGLVPPHAYASQALLQGLLKVPPFGCKVMTSRTGSFQLLKSDGLLTVLSAVNAAKWASG